MKVLVCGGRLFDDDELLTAILNQFHQQNNITTIIEGEATGADTLARLWAENNAITVERYPVSKKDWKKYGKSAGYKRNNIMLLEGKPDYVIAFPGGNGTKNMIEISKKAVVKVVEINKEEILDDIFDELY